MKTLYTLIFLLTSFFFTSCYTQFATVKHDDDYVVKRERRVKQEKREKYRDEQEYVYEDEDSSEYEDKYYEDDDDDFNTIEITEYHYSVRPYIYRYRYSNYDPWDYYWYDHHYSYRRPGVYVVYRPGYYDPYWTGFYCSPYDRYYYDPWDTWCGYPGVAYNPYYYDNYYYDPYYPNYRNRHGYYGSRRLRGRELRRSKRPFASLGSSNRTGTALRPNRPNRPGRSGVADNTGEIEMPTLTPVGRGPAIPAGNRNPDGKTALVPVKGGNEVSRTDRRKPFISDKSKTSEMDNIKKNKRPERITDNEIYKGNRNSKQKGNNRKYDRKYYHSSDRIKSELKKSNNETRTKERRKYPDQRDSRKYKTVERNKSDRSVNNETKSVGKYRKSTPTKSKSGKVRKDTYSPKPVKRSRESKPTKTKYRQSKPSKNKSKSSNSKSTYKGNRSSGKSYSAPKSSGRSSRSSSVRSAPSRSKSSSSSGSRSRSSSGNKSSSSRSKRK